MQSWSDDDVCWLAVAGKSEESSIVLQATEILFDKLQKEAYDVAMVGSPSLFPALYQEGCSDGVVKYVCKL